MVAGQRLENRHVRVSPREMRGLMQGERLQAPDTPSIVPLGKFQDTNAKAELLIISRWRVESNKSQVRDQSPSEWVTL